MENCQSREGIVGSIRKTEFRYFYPVKVMNSRAGSEMVLPFLFISFGNHQLSDHLGIAD
jgi:hypothetical protein